MSYGAKPRSSAKPEVAATYRQTSKWGDNRFEVT